MYMSYSHYPEEYEFIEDPHSGRTLGFRRKRYPLGKGCKILSWIFLGLFGLFFLVIAGMIILFFLGSLGAFNSISNDMNASQGIYQAEDQGAGIIYPAYIESCNF